MGKKLFLELCNALDSISKTTKRLEIQTILSEFLRNLILKSPEDLVPSLFLCTGTVFPQHFNVELGIGENLIKQVVSESTGLNIKTIEKKYIEYGDMSMIAMKNRVGQLFVNINKLTIVEVLDELRKIPKTNGKDSVKEKKRIMLYLINKASSIETKYLIRLFESNLKINLAQQTVLISLAYAFHNPLQLSDLENQSVDTKIKNQNEIVLDSNYSEKKPNVDKKISMINESLSIKDAVDIVKEAYNKNPDFESLVNLIFKSGIENLKYTCKIKPGNPVKPMLAQSCHNLTNLFEKLETTKFVSEYKYDGERVQIHSFNNKTRIFSRNLENISEKYPDIIGLNIHSTSFIIEGEVVAYKDGKIQSFQTLSTRKKKKVGLIEVQVCVFAFDLLLYNNIDLTDLPFKERKEMLLKNFKEIDNKFKIVKFIECKSPEDIENHFKESIQENFEGLMLKDVDSPYKPFLRSNSWIKLKHDYIENLGDSLDLVVMGGFYGKGKRKGTFGGFLLGCYNDEIDKFETCCKIGTGFSYENLKKFYSLFSNYITTNPREYIYNPNHVKPDVWIDPKYVWEIKATSLTSSPVYSAGQGNNRGISLRFPRFIKERSDKSVRDATTSEQIISMYNKNKSQNR